MARRTTDAEVEAGVVTAYDLQVFLEASGYSVDSTVNGDFDGRLGPNTQRALSSWIMDQIEANPSIEMNTVPAADGSAVTFTPASLAKPIVITARDADIDRLLGRPRPRSTPVPRSSTSDVPVPSKPFLRAGNPWLWALGVATVGGGVYAYRQGWIPGLGMIDEDDYDGLRAAATRSRGPSNSELIATSGLAAGLLLSVVGAMAWGYGKWGGRIDGSTTLEHRKAVGTNGMIMVFTGLTAAGMSYIYQRSL